MLRTYNKNGSVSRYKPVFVAFLSNLRRDNSLRIVTMMADDLQTDVEDKTFRVAKSVYDPWKDALFKQKGDQLVEVRLIAIEDVQAGVLGPPLSRRVDHVQSRVDEIAKIVEELSAKKLRVRRRLAEVPAGGSSMRMPKKAGTAAAGPSPSLGVAAEGEMLVNALVAAGQGGGRRP